MTLLTVVDDAVVEGPEGAVIVRKTLTATTSPLLPVSPCPQGTVGFTVTAGVVDPVPMSTGPAALPSVNTQLVIPTPVDARPSNEHDSRFVVALAVVTGHGVGATVKLAVSGGATS